MKTGWFVVIDWLIDNFNRHLVIFCSSSWSTDFRESRNAVGTEVLRGPWTRLGRRFWTCRSALIDCRDVELVDRLSLTVGKLDSSNDSHWRRGILNSLNLWLNAYFDLANGQLQVHVITSAFRTCLINWKLDWISQLHIMLKTLDRGGFWLAHEVEKQVLGLVGRVWEEEEHIVWASWLRQQWECRGFWTIVAGEIESWVLTARWGEMLRRRRPSRWRLMIVWRHSHFGLEKKFVGREF